MIRATNADIKRAGSNTTIVPDHGIIRDRAQAVEFSEMLAAIRKTLRS
jgi:hypothetical protein